MDCGAFRENHAAFIDSALEGDALGAMRQHRAECARCAEHDAMVRRALLLFRNMPVIEPSADFSARLHARIRSTEIPRFPAGPTILSLSPRSHGPRLGSFAAAAAGVLAAGYVAVAALDGREHARLRQLALAPIVVTAGPVVAVAMDTGTIIRSRTSPMASPAIVASVSMGMPVWPAALLATQAPMHFAAAEFSLVSLRH